MPDSPRPLRLAIVYALMLLLGGVLVGLICSYGATLGAPVTPEAATTGLAGTRQDTVLVHVLVALVAVITAGQVLGRLFAWIGQPPVIGEVVAGIGLGPSLLGPELSELILPVSVAPFLGVIAQLGVLLYMFTVGLDLHLGQLRARAHATIATSHASIVLPFVLGVGLALILYPRLSSAEVPFASFALFMGVAMSITAFPVLARILSDRGMLRTDLGVIALSCAATDDVTAWCLLAFVVGIARAEVSGAVGVIATTLVYLAVMLVVVRPLLRRVVARWPGEPLPRSAVAFSFVALLLSALATEAIGIHAIFGAFLLGAVIPHDSGIARVLGRQIESVVGVLLLPAFFAFTGMRTRIDLVAGVEAWVICGLIIVVATVGKFGGTLIAGRLTGLSWRHAAALGTLMNTRGLMELIVLNIGLDMHVISPTLFAMMVIMALVTTLGTAPALALVLARDERQAI